MKNIALFIDGTWNSADKATPTNVYKLYRAAEACKGPRQIVKYIKGVGTGGLLDKILGGISGFGTAERIREAYLFLAQNYNSDHGDQIYLFGFSRGAFAARSLAGFVGLVGILLREKASARYIDQAYELYERGVQGRESYLSEFLRELPGAAGNVRELPPSIPIHFIGVWDTVRVLGAIIDGRDITARYTRYHRPDLPEWVYNARHALAIHDLRPEYEPTLWENRRTGQTLEQVWFTGAHADVGGGYKDTSLSDIALEWMANESSKFGLLHNWAKPTPASGNTSGLVHHEELVQSALPRRALAEWRNHSAVTKESFAVHRSARERLLSGGSTRYQNERKPGAIGTSGAYSNTLAEVDQLTVELHLERTFTSFD
jgi:uncharacterized protein (DUF2235 family)